MPRSDFLSHQGVAPRAWLALAVALLPAAATHVAYALSIRDGFAPACLPYWDGCTSISRAARHGDGNLLFKMAMLPCALALAWLWWEARRWLARQHEDPGAAMVVLGAVGALALAVYVLFLGDEGEVSRWLRRYGALAYFAATFLAQFWFVRRRWHGGGRDAATRALLATSMLLLVGGLVSTYVSGTLEDRALKDRVENAIEWTLGALFTLWFLALAWLWRQEPDVGANSQAKLSPRSPGFPPSPPSPRL